MTVLDATIVNVAIPSIRTDLQFSDLGIVWVVNAYMLTFGGCLLLGGRLGDLFGRRRLFLIGVALFTVASLICGSSSSRAFLVVARAAQGVGGAVVVAVALSLITNMFSEGVERTKALGIYGFVCGGGGSVGLLLGGAVTTGLGWRWIFFVNLPIGIAICALTMILVPRERSSTPRRRLDVAGAITLTASLMLAIYSVMTVQQSGWTAPQSVGLLVLTVLLFAAFVVIEIHAPLPLVPLQLFMLPQLRVANTVRILWAAGVSPWFFVSALYMQDVLGYTPLQIALAFLPSNVLMATLSLGVAAKWVPRVGLRAPLSAGFLLGAMGLALFARVPVHGDVWADIMPAMILLGVGAGIAVPPLLLASMADVKPSETGVASGVINTSGVVGSALGLAITASFAAARTRQLLASGATSIVALTSGYRVAFWLGATLVSLAALIAMVFIRTPAAQKSKEALSDTHALS